MHAQNVMTTVVKVVHPDTTIEDIAKTLLETKVSAVPVVRGDGVVVGMVSEGDLVRRVENETMYADSWWLALLSTAKDRVTDFRKLHGRTASDVMTKDVISVSGDCPVSKIARILDWYCIKRVPVIEDGKLFGIVSRADLIRNLAQTDTTTSNLSVEREEVAARQQAVLDVIASSRVRPYMVNAFVDGAEVELFGLIDSPDDSELLAEEILELPGVSNVKTDMLRQPTERDRAIRG